MGEPIRDHDGDEAIPEATVARLPVYLRGLLELADESSEVQVEARCWCGERATHNARLVDGEQVYDGQLVVVDDPDDHQVTYELRCRRHWLAGDSGDAPRVTAHAAIVEA